MTRRTLIVGTRGSKLALWQAGSVRSALLERLPDTDVQISIIKTRGDRMSASSLSDIGGKGAFVREIEVSLLNEEVDVAVHSLKDLPSELPDGLKIGAVSERDHPEDAVVSKKNRHLDDLIPGSRVGTGSVRRKAQILHYYPHLEVVPIRGNVDTRVKKLYLEDLDAVILARAGLNRMDLQHKISQVLDPNVFIPAPGQGTIAMESREDDKYISDILDDINHPETLYETLLERSFLKHLEGDCNVPAGCYARASGEGMSAVGFVSDELGRDLVTERSDGSRQEAEDMGKRLAESLLSKAAD